jgi:2-polyprenyl-3-methyl-5-hydroxy-6-metoxy-1,4-benzoquinol methylase
LVAKIFRSRVLMTSMQTIEYYEANADTFFEQTVGVDMAPLYSRFLTHVPNGGVIVDAGCGSGRDAKAFLERGYQVSAFDASAGLATKAAELLGIPVACRRFEDLTEVGAYDGIWACASLLHVAQVDLPGVVSALTRALRLGGVLYASFKQGAGERTDDNGRHFTDMTPRTLHWLLAQVRELESIEVWETTDRRGDRLQQSWWNVLARKR